jgi:hypothetical protein
MAEDGNDAAGNGGNISVAGASVGVCTAISHGEISTVAPKGI